MPTLNVIIGSTRPQRIGPAISSWFVDRARAHGAFEVRSVDLAELNLPLFDEPKHPRLREYAHEHTKRWSGVTAAADAFVFVIPEYNHSAPPAVVNAIDYLVHEWKYKAASFVSYGGVSGGTRSLEATRQMLSSLEVVTLAASVNIPFVWTALTNGAYPGSAVQDASAKVMLDDLAKWTAALSSLRG